MQWEPIEPILSQMVDSAGGRSGGESISVENADSTWEHELGPLPTEKLRSFLQNGPPVRPETTPAEEPQPIAANEIDGAIDLIHPELSEPFAPKPL